MARKPTKRDYQLAVSALAGQMIVCADLTGELGAKQVGHLLWMYEHASLSPWAPIIAAAIREELADMVDPAHLPASSRHYRAQHDAIMAEYDRLVEAAKERVA